MDASRLMRFARLRIDRERLADFCLRLVVLLGIDVLRGDKQMPVDEVRVRRHRLLELGRRLFRIGQRQASRPSPRCASGMFGSIFRAS